MNIRTGIDVIEIDRIKESIEKFGDTFLNTIYTEKEIEFCEKHKIQKYQHYAARFAAKEATFKALSMFYKQCNWKDYEVLNDENGKPNIYLHNFEGKIESIDLSLSHCKQYAAANVVVLF